MLLKGEIITKVSICRATPHASFAVNADSWVGTEPMKRCEQKWYFWQMSLTFELERRQIFIVP